MLVSAMDEAYCQDKSTATSAEGANASKVPMYVVNLTPITLEDVTFVIKTSVFRLRITLEEVSEAPKYSLQCVLLHVDTNRFAFIM